MKKQHRNFCMLMHSSCRWWLDFTVRSMNTKLVDTYKAHETQNPTTAPFALLGRLPSSGTSRFCTMNFEMGLLPSNPGVQLTLMARWVWVSRRAALTLIGAKGSSMTLSLADRVSLPPGDFTEHVYWPTSAARTSWISIVPSLRIDTRWLTPGWIILNKRMPCLLQTYYIR